MARRRSFCSAGMRRLSTAFWMALLWVHSSSTAVKLVKRHIGDARLGSGRPLRQRLGEVPRPHHVHVVLRARDADDPLEELRPEPLVEEQLHEHADGEAHRVLVVAFQPRSRLRQRGIRVRGEPATGQLVAGGPVVDEGEEALDLADAMANECS